MAYAKGQAERQFNGSLAAYLRELLYDAKTYYGVPLNQLERLEADRKRLHIDEPRRYVQDIISLWAEQLATRPSDRADKSAKAGKTGSPKR
jgi:hypothetical protein